MTGGAWRHDLISLAMQPARDVRPGVAGRCVSLGSSHSGLVRQAVNLQWSIPPSRWFESSTARQFQFLFFTQL